MIGTIVALAAWTAICLVLRHEYRAQRRVDGTGWKAPGA